MLTYLVEMCYISEQTELIFPSYILSYDFWFIVFSKHI